MTAMLDPELTLQGGMAIALQIRTQVRDLIAAGALATGEQLPTVRSLAVELTKRPNLKVSLVTYYDGSGDLEGLRNLRWCSPMTRIANQ